LTAFDPLWTEFQKSQTGDAWETFCSDRDRETLALPRWRAEDKDDASPSKTFGASPFSPRFGWGDFEALSYCWGSKNNQGQIFINGTLTPVQKSAEDALRRLRELPESACGMKYWIDSICIDQEDVSERNDQMKMMHEVYGKAYSVIGWLGEAGDESDAAINIITIPTSTFWPTPRKSDLLPLLSLLSRPYWRRVWIVQELALNHHATTFVCGDRAFSRAQMLMTLEFCVDFYSDMDKLESKSSGTDSVLTARNICTHCQNLLRIEKKSDGFTTIIDALRLSQGGQATDDRDRIYGIRSLFDSALKQGIVADYRLPVEAMYLNFASAYLRSKGLMSLLLWGGNCGSKALPSWVPDWTSPALRNHIRMLRSRKANGSVFLAHRIADDGRTLVCEGKLCGEVQRISVREHESSGSVRPGLEKIGADVGWKVESPNVPDPELLRALYDTLVMQHPNKHRGTSLVPSWGCLEIPWRLELGVDSEFSQIPRPWTFDQRRIWQPLLSTSFFGPFDAFRKANAELPIQSYKLKDFFPYAKAEHAEFWLKTAPQDEVLEWTRNIEKDMNLAAISLKGRRLITTSDGKLGLVPESVRVGDVIAIVGCSFPILLRRTANNSYFFLGECYIHGMMDGEAMDGVKKRSLQSLNII
jgi:hypothetical protein